MALNYIWAAFFLIAFAVAVFKTFMAGWVGLENDPEIFSRIMHTIFDRAKLGFELSLYLTGVLALWMGIMKIGEKSGMIDKLAALVRPFFKRIFPGIPEHHPAHGAMMMNFSANMLGLDNAATPLGLKAMKELQSLNPRKDTATDAQIMFLVLNTSGLTLIPVSILALRAAHHSQNPTDVFIPILLATFFSTLAGLMLTMYIQTGNFKKWLRWLFDPVTILYLGGALAVIGGLIAYLNGKTPEEINRFTNVLSNGLLFAVIALFIGMGLRAKINVYDAFIEGAKGGFDVAVTIIPYLVAMLTAIGAFTASGAMDFLLDGFRAFFGLFFSDLRFVDALPVAFLKPLTGGGARAAMIETWELYGVDSFVGHLTSVLQGSTETTFYVLAVYFGSVGIKKVRYAVWAGLFADLAGIITAIILSYKFFGHLP
ncbi:MAG: spore maturation protein [Chlorobi bacterium]|nr:spore maturation protein [Chlorobiota bacterium]